MKTVCIYHSIDLDGWMSAAIVKYWFLTLRDMDKKPYITEANLKDISRTEQDAEQISFIGYNYGQPIPHLSEYDKVIMCDISFPPQEMNKLISHSDNKNFIWLDHHISAISNVETNENWAKGLRDTKFAACELTWKFFFPEMPMPEIVRLLGRYDCFGSKDTDEHIKVLEFQYGSRQVISNYNEAYDWLVHCINYNRAQSNETPEQYIRKKGSVIYEFLCAEAKQNYKNGFEIILFEQCGFRIEEQIPRKFICINKERFNPINFGIDYHKDGYDGAACFHYANGKWNFSLYNDNGLVDCSVIAKQFGGGGHKGASGFIVEISKIDGILQP